MENVSISVDAMTIVISNLIVFLTFLGTSIALHLSIRADMRDRQKESKDFHNAMKDFHGRLISIEERNKLK